MTTIHVTQERINRAKVLVSNPDGDFRANCCAVALALREAGFSGASVGPHSADLHCGSVELPYEAMEFIRRFDNNEPVSPFTFDLPIDPPAAA